MPRFIAAGHVTRDEMPEGDRLGGSAAYTVLAAARLGWRAGIVTSAGPDFDARRELPEVAPFVGRSAATTRFRNRYRKDGARTQHVLARADTVDPGLVAGEWRSPEVLLLAPVAAELPARAATRFDARLVGATGQGWLREIDSRDGRVSPCEWSDPGSALEGVDVLFISLEDVGGDAARAHALLAHVPLVALTLGKRGVELLSRRGTLPVPTLPRPELDPTGAGDVFAAAFLLRYHELADAPAAAAFACCAASCAVEGAGVATLGDRAEVERRLALRERMLEEAR